MDIDHQLQTLRSFQKKYPKSHVGGSIGLFLRGIDLKRNLQFSDLDVKTPNFKPKFEGDGISSNTDFDYTFFISKDDNKHHNFKLDIRVCDNDNYDIVNYNGINYNVTTKKEILSWKQKYAEMNIQKHIDDLITIATGVRPKESFNLSFEKNNNIDDLPF